LCCYPPSGTHYVRATFLQKGRREQASRDSNFK
jgi:hypothetical protein